MKRFTGKEELRHLYAKFFAALRPLSSTVPNQTVDSETGKVLPEQIYWENGRTAHGLR